MTGKISVGTVPKGLEPIYIHRQSRALSEILVELLRDSNNYVANQVFLEIGGRRLGGPVSLEKSLEVANGMLAAHGLADAIHLKGSGISRNDRFAARGLAKVLELFAPHADLLHGHDGGMNKTGSMDGVRTLAGYAGASSHGRVRFVISLSTNDEMRFPPAPSYRVRALAEASLTKFMFPQAHECPQGADTLRSPGTTNETDALDCGLRPNAMVAPSTGTSSRRQPSPVGTANRAIS